MTTQRLIELLVNRVTVLRNELNIASAMGDVERVISLESEISSTEVTINQLKSL